MEQTLELEIDPYSYNQIHSTVQSNHINGGRKIFKNVLNNWVANKMVLDSYLTPYTKTNLRWVIELNIKVKTVEHLE
jgi:hypothetical protein